MRAHSSAIRFDDNSDRDRISSKRLLAQAVVKRGGGSDRTTMIAAASELFARCGFKTTTLQEIATLANCPMKAIRREFGGKLHLLEAVLLASRSNPLPRFQSVSQHNTLCQDLSQLVEWEVRRMRAYKEFLECALPHDCTDPGVLRVVAKISFCSTEFIIARLARHRDIGPAERQFFLYAIQAAGFALGFARSDLAHPADTARRIRRLASILAESVEGSESPFSLPQFPPQPLHPV
jgi:AcrR family transcriptional regulator